MHKGLNHWKAGGQYGTHGIRVNGRITSTRIVDAAEVTGDSQYVFEVSGQGSVPSHGVIAGLQVLVLGSSKEFHLLGKRRNGEDYGEEDYLYRSLPHATFP
jgi:hypothetical protein